MKQFYALYVSLYIYIYIYIYAPHFIATIMYIKYYIIISHCSRIFPWLGAEVVGAQEAPILTLFAKNVLALLEREARQILKV